MSLLQTVSTYFTQADIRAAVPVNALNTFLITTKTLISALGTLVILIGAIVAIVRFIRLRFVKANIRPGYDMNKIRLDMGQSVILGLEFIVAADVIETTTAPDYYSVGILVIVVAIRTLLSYSLNKEMGQLINSR